jgi:predicted nucleotidyltransferase
MTFKIDQMDQIDEIDQISHSLSAVAHRLFFIEQTDQIDFFAYCPSAVFDTPNRPYYFSLFSLISHYSLCPLRCVLCDSYKERIAERKSFNPVNVGNANLKSQPLCDNVLWERIMNKIFARPSREGKDQIPGDRFRAIINFAKRYVDIVAIYIFGSTATAKNRSRSDIDMAIMVRRRMKSSERVQMETSLSNLLKKDVDLIIFGEASPLLQHQILKSGRLVYEKDPKARVRQEVAARCEYLDTTFLYKVIEAYI